MWEIIDLDKHFKNLDNLMAHKTKSRTETLKEHSDRSLEVFMNIDKEKNLEKIIDGILAKLSTVQYDDSSVPLSGPAASLIKKMFVNAIYLHDVGKINPMMQQEKFDNNFVKAKNIKDIGLSTEHSFLSTLIFMDIFYPEIGTFPDNKEKMFLFYVLATFGYIIASHHGNLENMQSWTKNFNNKKAEFETYFGYTYFYKGTLLIKPFVDQVYNRYDNRSDEFSAYEFFTLTKLLQSSLIASDFNATHQFFRGIKTAEISLGTIKDSTAITAHYHKTPIYKGNLKFKKTPRSKKISPINKLRSEMFWESEESLLKDMGSNIFYLEMPTGAGKTASSINLAMNLIEKGEQNKLIYIFPFNTLSDQTVGTLEGVMPKEIEVEAINSVTPIRSVFNEHGDVNYEASVLDRQMWNYPIICTSHVNFFNTLFGVSREANMPFFQLINSVVILDEIQSYNNGIWREIIEFLYKYADLLNIKIIIMSATLPDLEKLVGFDNDKFVRLIKDRDRYFNNPIFSKRVEIDISLIKEKIDFYGLAQRIVKEIHHRNKLLSDDVQYSGAIYSTALTVFINKGTAQSFEKFFRKFVKHEDIEVLELDGDSSKVERESVLNRVRENASKNIVLISTQLIEAGVDIDMDLGFKDKSIFDSEEQVVGRVNRSCAKKYCKAFFFNYDDESKIYQSDLRLGRNLENPKYLEYFKTKNFEAFYDEIIEVIKRINGKADAQNSFKEFVRTIKTLRFESILNKMKLIEDKTLQIYVPYSVKFEKVDAVGKITTEIIDGQKVWDDYMEIMTNSTIGYAERAFKRMALKPLLAIFIYQVYGDSIMGLEEIYGTYFIPDSTGIIENNKLNRDALKKKYEIVQK